MQHSTFKYSLFVLLICVFTTSYSQSEKLSTELKKTLRKAELLYANSDYRQAVVFYEKAALELPNDAEVAYLLGNCYLQLDKYSKAVAQFENAKRLNYTSTPEFEFLLADAYRYNYQFAEAQSIYEQFLNLDSLPIDKNSLQKRIAECTSGNWIMKDTSLFAINNVGANMNTIYSDYGLYLLPNSNLCLFTSKRNTSVGGILNPYDGQYYEDIFCSDYKNSAFSLSYSIDNKLNTPDPEACLGVFKSGEGFYLYKADNNGDIYQVKYENGKFHKPEFLAFINTLYAETSISTTSDNKFTYFVSDRPTSLGGKDLFVIEKNDQDVYSAPINLGENINTLYDEESVFINETNDTLYFSSKGHNSMGGYDIFRSTKDALGKWQKAQNMRFPFNSAADDLYLLPVDTAFYISSTREDTFGDIDIYFVSKKLAIKQQLLSQVEDSLENKTVIVDNNNTNDKFETPKFELVLFHYNATTLLQGKEEIEKLCEFMNKYLTTVVEIQGHTDNVGKPTMNQKLSEQRALAVKELLLAKGIAVQRIKTKGFGASVPLFDNTNLHNKTKNRRVEFVITKE